VTPVDAILATGCSAAPRRSSGSDGVAFVCLASAALALAGRRRRRGQRQRSSRSRD
jgi:uncharacterized protein YfiM (DUF2279 family)